MTISMGKNSLPESVPIAPNYRYYMFPHSSIPKMGEFFTYWTIKKKLII